MPTTTHHRTGTACWPELATSDPQAAKKFYGDLFGWQAQDDDMGNGQKYTTLKLKGRKVGALHGMPIEQQGKAVPPHWMNYIAVDDADRVTQDAKRLGATIIMEPMDVMEHGRMAVIQDPTGAVFSLWQPNKHAGVELFGEPGSLVWTELYTDDPDKAAAFYTSLFGYTTEKMTGGPKDQPMDYTIFKNGKEQGSGMLKKPKEIAHVPPHWLTYFATADADATVQKAKTMGAEVLMPPTDIPNIGRFAVLKDPQGAVFATIKPQPM